MKYKEIWKDVVGFEEKYQISNYGRLKNKEKNTIYKLTNQYGDYFSVVLTYKDKKRSVRIHRLVAEAFIPNPENKPEVNHKDLNKQNNKVDNLEWCTFSENTRHAMLNGVNLMCGFNRHNKTKFNKKYGKIYQFDKNKNKINEFDSLKDANEITGVCTRNILHCINHQRKTAGGYIWICEKESVINGL